MPEHGIQDSDYGEQDGVDRFCQEIELVVRQRHPYVLRLLGASLTPPDYAWLVTEYLPRGTLLEWLHGDKSRTDKRIVPLPPLSERIRMALEISQGMEVRILTSLVC